MNRLTGARSAYLRQHAHQDVHWWPFGTDAFAEAARRDVPVFISIGYAACHWCHVMSRESFDDPSIAGYLNQQFVAIKVDREEQPEVDELYMSATQTLSGEGGWPMSVFTLPDGRAFHAGTYFPPRPTGGRPSFRMLLEGVVEAWRERRALCEEQAARLAEHLGEMADQQRALIGLGSGVEGLGLPGSAVHDGGATPAMHEAVLAQLAREEQPDGGFAPAPKFPPSTTLDYLLELAASEEDEDLRERALGLASRTLDTIGHSALVDHVGGGFHRYCVDNAWQLPHFEKMLYDNALLLRLTARWSALCLERAGGPAAGGEADDLWHHRAALGRRLAEGSADWMRRELLVWEADGSMAGLASSLDADVVLADGSHAEGATYVFTREELRAALGEGGAGLAARLAGVPVQEGVAVVQHPAPVGEPGRDDGPRTLAFRAPLSCADWAAWDRALPRLREVRAERPAPARDDKVVAGWNGLAVRALAEAGLLLDRPDLVELAEELAAALWHRLWDARTRTVARVEYRRGSGLLEDYAGLALGFQAVATAGGDAAWVRRSRELLDAATAHLRLDDAEHAADAAEVPLTELHAAVTEGAAANAAAAHQGSVILRARAGRPALSGLDGATPSGLALYATAQLIQGGLDANDARVSRAEALTAHVGRIAARAPAQFGTALAASVRVRAGLQLAVVGGTEGERRAALRRAVVHGMTAFAESSGEEGYDGEAAGDGPVTAGAAAPKPPGIMAHRPAGPGGELRLYLCRGHVCDAPYSTIAELERVYCS